MKSPVAALLGVVAGLAIGGVCIYHQHTLLKKVYSVRGAFQDTDEHLADFGVKPPEFQDTLKREDDYAANMFLAALVKLEAGDTDTAKSRLIGAINLYYIRWHNNGGDSNVLSGIEKYAAQYPDLAAAISNTKTNK
jgi:hypothetical protein